MENLRLTHSWDRDLTKGKLAKLEGSAKCERCQAVWVRKKNDNGRMQSSYIPLPYTESHGKFWRCRPNHKEIQQVLAFMEKHDEKVKEIEG